MWVNENNHRKYFNNIFQAQNTPEIPEDAAIGYKLDFKISATDPDSTAELTASIDWKSTTGTKNNQQINNAEFEGFVFHRTEFVIKLICFRWFEVAMTNGEVVIRVAKGLKWEIIDTIQLKLIVTDVKTEKNLDNDQSTGNYSIIKSIQFRF